MKKLFGAATVLAIAAATVKVVKDILDADEEENQKFINLENEEEKEVEIEE